MLRFMNLLNRNIRTPQILIICMILRVEINLYPNCYPIILFFPYSQYFQGKKAKMRLQKKENYLWECVRQNSKMRQMVNITKTEIKQLISYTYCQKMSYVQQICDGYSKKSLMGNWYEQRLYPDQPFREKQQKHVRGQDEGITCFDNTGFQRQLPRLERRHKWETSGRIILNDGLNQKTSVMRAEYPNGEQQSSVAEMSRPFAKYSDDVKGTSIHPHSEMKNVQKSYHYLNNKNAQQLSAPRDVLMYGSDFRSTLPQHPPAVKQTHFDTIYRNSYNNPQKEDVFTKTNSQFNRTRNSAGQFNPTKQETVRNISTLVGENKKQVGDEKERTDVQRSWVPPKDTGLAYSMGKTFKDFKYANIPKNDIQTSLNMNVGIHTTHPKDVENNYFRHVRQDVTIRENNTLCPRP